MYKLVSHRYVTVRRGLYKTDVGESELVLAKQYYRQQVLQEAPDSLRPRPGLGPKVLALVEAEAELEGRESSSIEGERTRKAFIEVIQVDEPEGQEPTSGLRTR